MASLQDKQTSLFTHTAKGLLWAGIGTGGQTFIQFLVLVVLARILAPEDFGIVAAAMVITGLSTMLSLVGIGPALVRHPNLGSKHIGTAYATTIILGLLLFVAINLLASTIESLFRIGGLATVLHVLSIILPIRSIGVVSECLLQRELLFKRLSAITLFSYAFGYAPLGISFAMIGYGPYSLVLAQIGLTTSQSLLLLIFRNHPILFKIDSASLQELVGYGGGITLGRFGSYTAGHGDNVVVGRILGAASLGIYGRAYQLMTIPVTVIGTVLDRVLFPAMAKIQNAPTRLSSAYCRGISAVSLLIVPTSVFMILFAEEIVRIVLGNGWDEVVIPLQILSAVLFFRTGYKICDSLIRATGAVYRRAWRQWIFAGAIVCFSAVGTIWGVNGVALGVSLAIVLNYLMMVNLSLQIIDLKWSRLLMAHIHGLALGGICGILGYALKQSLVVHLNDVASVGLALAVFGISVIILWRVMPKVFIGRDGRWFLIRISKHMPIIRLVLNPRFK